MESRQAQWWGRERDGRQRKADKHSGGAENETAGRGKQTSTVVGQRTRQQRQQAVQESDETDKYSGGAENETAGRGKQTR